MSKTNGLITNSVDFDQMQCSAVCDLDLPCLLRPVCHRVNTVLGAPVALWIGEMTLNPGLGFSPLWFDPRSGHMWESQVLLMDGQVFSPGSLVFAHL